MLCDFRNTAVREKIRKLRQRDARKVEARSVRAVNTLLLRSSLSQLLQGIHTRVTRDVLRYNNVTPRCEV